jgi:hypothetical protein
MTNREDHTLLKILQARDWDRESGCSPLLIPLANYAAPSIIRSNRANRVTARGFCANQSATLIRFNAEAIAKCCNKSSPNPRTSSVATRTLKPLPKCFPQSQPNSCFIHNLDGSPLAPLQGLPKDFKPVANWDDRDEAWTNVVQGIRQAIKDLRR